MEIRLEQLVVRLEQKDDYREDIIFANTCVNDGSDK